MKLLGGMRIDFEEDMIYNEKNEQVGLFSAFKEYALENHPDIVEKHRLKSHLTKNQGSIQIHRIVNWVEVIDEIV